jgi:ankyrin repeat protein
MITVFDLAANGYIPGLEQYAGDVNVVDDWGLTPLDRAIKHDQIECVKYLVNERDAKITRIPRQQWNPLYFALSRGHIECAKFLIDKGAVCDNYENAVHNAMSNGHVESVRFLLERGVKCDIDELLRTAVKDRQLGCAKLLLEKGANVNKFSEDGWAPIHAAAENGYLDLLQLLVEHGADMNALTKLHNSSPLSMTLWRFDLSCAIFLLSKGANPLIDHVTSYVCKEGRLLLATAKETFKPRQTIQAMMSVKTHKRLGHRSSLKMLTGDVIQRLHRYVVSSSPHIVVVSHLETTPDLDQTARFF